MLQMPIVGLGTWLADNEEELIKAIETALEIGYRHFDTAYVYRNETVLGKVLKKWLDTGKIKREELFIVTKLPILGIKLEKVGHFLRKSLENLQLDYVDLYLVHVPFGLDATNDNDLPIENGEVVIDKSTNLEAVWVGMEEQVALGKTKSIGISNFDENQIQRIVKSAKIKPANLQVELHVYFQQKPLRAVCDEYGISVCAYSPLGSGGRKEFYEHCGMKFEPINMFADPVVISIATKQGKTPAQILLRFLVQQGITVIPKSTNVNRLKENFQLLDWSLNSDEMKALEALDKKEFGRTLDFRFLPGIEKHPEFSKSIRP